MQPFVDGDDRLRGACPWHPDATRSLHATDTAWQCFACRAGGDAVDCNMRRDAVDKRQAEERFQEFRRSKQ
ncbi:MULTISPECIES: CHC2 zinc finger domain-containing protein [unclassified Sphingomonas]|uniref:CHC2 zinc finger domain-containing protein n=1 Tax=unclassified Sphingomonas TaxID=196159 RepID=UPI0009E7B581